MTDFVLVDHPADGLLRLTMNQPAKKNAMNATMRGALRQAVAAASVDQSAKAIILTGAGGEFSAGGDIQGLMAVNKTDFRRSLKDGHEVVKTFWWFEKPMVAAIEGVGVGGGLALAMCCDHIVMGRSARIGFTFMKIGFVPDWGTPFTVARRVGPAAARRLFQTCDIVGSEDALRLGLVDEVTDDGKVQERAIAAAQKLAAQPPKAFAFTKRFLQTMPDNLDAALEMEAMVQENCFKSDEFLRGVERFIR